MKQTHDTDVLPAPETKPAQRGKLLHIPSVEQRSRANLTQFARFLEERGRGPFTDYPALHAWSLSESEAFWRAVWEYFEVGGGLPPNPLVPRGSWTGPSTGWFNGLTLNYAELALRAQASRIALICCDESGARREVTYGALRREVMRVRAGLVSLGVQAGDRVAGYLPNGLHSVVALLASASLGAIWSSCPSEFGVQSVSERFIEVTPSVLFAASGYSYAGKRYDRLRIAREIRAALPSVKHLVWIDDGNESLAPGELRFEDLGSTAAPDEFLSVPFCHPLWILYSSGTTGRPKAIVHGHGGIALEHLKVLSLHSDLGAESRFFWFSTTGWMMWNYLVSGLTVGATIVLFDGSPAHPDVTALWRLAARERVTYFGASAAFLMACRGAAVELGTLDLSALRAVGSTGSTLPPEGFEWVYSQLPASVRLDSVSGGTDVCTAFLVGCPWLPVRSGELACAALGAGVLAIDDAGHLVLDRVGELVLTHAMPSMPVCFWNDEQGKRLHEAYFARFHGLWHHGDWVSAFSDGAFAVYGRSDATLNRGGVRMGSSEFYRAVELDGRAQDSLVLEVDTPGQAGYLMLFVVLRQGELNAELEAELRRKLREQLSPRHVPDAIIEVRDIPYTQSGKKLEIPIKRILSGVPFERAVNLGALRNPQALIELVSIANRHLDSTRSPAQAR